MSSRISSTLPLGLALALAGTSACGVTVDDTGLEGAAEGAVSAADVVRGDHLWYSCHTAATLGGATWHYDTAGLNPSRSPSTAVHVTQTSSAGTKDFGWLQVDARGGGLFDTGDGRLAVRFVPRVGQGPTADYAPSVRVYHGSIGLLASGENGWCAVDTTDQYGTACAPTTHYSCGRESCGCLDVGAANEDPWGNALIDTIAGGAAGSLRSLARSGLAGLVSLGVGAAGGGAAEELLVAEVSSGAGNLGKYLASSYVARFNFLIEAELKTVRSAVLNKLLQAAASARPGTLLDVVGEVGADTITLGEARAFTVQTGRELGLVYNVARGRLKVVIGDNATLARAMQSGEELLWHTHPSGFPPSLKDGIVLRTRNYDTSFVIPARAGGPESIFQYWPEPPAP